MLILPCHKALTLSCHKALTQPCYNLVTKLATILYDHGCYNLVIKFQKVVFFIPSLVCFLANQACDKHDIGHKVAVSL